MLAADNMLEKLDSVDVHLDCAIRSLLGMNSPAGSYALSLESAADLVTSLEPSRAALTARPCIEPLLQSIAVKAMTARKLLDGAADFYFGALLNNGSLEQGYSASGVAGRCGGGSLRVEG